MKQKKSVEIQLQDLDLLVSSLEQDNIDLDAAVDKYAKALKLSADISNTIHNAEQQVNQLNQELNLAFPGENS